MHTWTILFQQCGTVQDENSQEWLLHYKSHKPGSSHERLRASSLMLAVWQGNIKARARTPPQSDAIPFCLILLSCSEPDKVLNICVCIFKSSRGVWSGVEVSLSTGCAELIHSTVVIWWAVIGVSFLNVTYDVEPEWAQFPPTYWKWQQITAVHTFLSKRMAGNTRHTLLLLFTHRRQ